MKAIYLDMFEETALIKNYVMVPSGVQGKLTSIKDGTFAVEDTIAVIETKKGPVNVTMLQKRYVRVPGKYTEKLQSDTPLITGQRVVDFFFPVAKGGAQESGPIRIRENRFTAGLAKCADADVVSFT